MNDLSQLSRISMTKFMFEKIKICVGDSCDSYESDVKEVESETFLNNLNNVLKGINRAFPMILLLDLNCWICDRKK